MVDQNCPPPEGPPNPKAKLPDLFTPGKPFPAGTPTTVRADVTGRAVSDLLNKADADMTDVLVKKLHEDRGKHLHPGYNPVQRVVFPMGELLNRAEAALDLPLYRHFRAIENGITELEVQVRPWIEEVRAIARGLPRQRTRHGQSQGFGMDNLKDRQDTWQLFEHMIANKWGGKSPQVSRDNLAKLRAEFSPAIWDAAQKIEDLIIRWGKSQEGWGKGDDGIRKMMDFFLEFPAYRKGGHMAVLQEASRRVELQRMPPKIRPDDPTRRQSVQELMAEQRIQLGGEMAEDLYTGRLLIDDKEYDFAVILSKIFRKHGEVKYMAGPWNRARTEIAQYAKAGRMPKDLYDLWMRYTSTVRNIPDGTQINIAQWMAKVENKVFDKTGGRLGTKEVGAEKYLNLSQNLLSMNYMANMGFNPGVAMRNFMQPFITSFPVLGKDMLYGLQMMSDPTQTVLLNGKRISATEYLQRMGAVTTTETPMQAAEAAAGMADMARTTDSAVGSKWHQAWDQYKSAGWWGFRKAETWNRGVAYFGMTHKARKAAEAFMKSDGSAKAWKRFYEGSALDVTSPKGGYLETSIKGNLLKAKAASGIDRKSLVELVVHQLGIEHVNQTQFMYRAGNSAPGLQTTVGKFFGQYGTWPSWYIAHMNRLAMRGSTQRRLKHIGTWLGANWAMGAAGEEIFGADVSNWVFFSPLSYQGGPMLDVMGSLYSQAAVGLGDALPEGIAKQFDIEPVRDPITRMRASGAVRAIDQLNPFPRQFGGISRVFEDIDNPFPGGKLIDDWQAFQNQPFGEFMRGLTGFPTHEGPTRIDHLKRMVE